MRARAQQKQAGSVGTHAADADAQEGEVAWARACIYVRVDVQKGEAGDRDQGIRSSRCLVSASLRDSRSKRIPVVLIVADFLFSLVVSVLRVTSLSSKYFLRAWWISKRGGNGTA